MAAKKFKKSIGKHWWFLVGIIVLALITVVVLELTNKTSLLKKPTSSSAVVKVGTPVAPPSNSTTTKSTQQSSTQKINSNNTLTSNGSAVDTQGKDVPSTSPNQWVTSASGFITVKSPVANAQLTNGDIVAGSAKVNQINYRLIDNAVGVTAEGTLNVVNGNFSGTLHFQPQGTGGRLDVFTTNSQGVEYNEVQINVSF